MPIKTEVAVELRYLAAFHAEHGNDRLAAELRQDADLLDAGEATPSYMHALDAIGFGVAQEAFRF